MPNATIHSRYVMKEAWALARRGCRTYGGNVRQYISEALRIVWAELMANPVAQTIRDIITETRARKAAGTFPSPRRFRNRVYGGSYL